MSNQINPVLVSDPVMMLDDKINFSVLRGAQSIMSQQFNATSATANTHQYNIQVPSLNTVLSRNLEWTSVITISITGTPAVGKYLVNYGVSDVLSPYPLNMLTNNMNVTINNTSLALPVNQVLDPLLRSVDKDDINRWAGSTPTQLDYYGNYTVFGGASPLPTPNNSPFNNYLANFDRDDPPRGAFQLLSITNNTIGAAVPQPTTVQLTFKVTEPIFISPFIFGNPKDHAGLSGINQISISTQMDSSATRAIRWIQDATQYSAKQVSAVAYDASNTYITCHFFTPKPSQLIPQNIVTPLMNFVNYQTNSTSSAPTIVSGAASTLTSNSVQLNSIPDKVIVWVGKSNATLTNTDADVYCKIESVSITFNGQSGLLSTFKDVDLYRASYQSGSCQTFLEYSGQAQLSNVANVSNTIVTVGSVLCLDFGTVINIPQDYYCAGSLTTAQFQIVVNYTNTTGKTITPVLNTLFMTSGVLSTQNGSSSAYTSGVLSKQVVLDTVEQQSPANKEELNRLVGGKRYGGGLLSSLKAFSGNIMPALHKRLGPHVKQLVHNVANEAVNSALSQVPRNRMKGRMH